MSRDKSPDIRLTPVRLSRRTFVKGAAAAGALSALGGSLSGCGEDGAPPSATPVVVDESHGTSVTDSYSFLENSTSLTQTAEWTLPLGTVPKPAEGNWIPLISPATLTTSIAQASAFSLASASTVPLLNQPVSQERNFALYDLAGSDSLMVWVELEMNTQAWVLYAQSFKDGVLTGSAKELFSAEGEYDPPQIAVSGNTVVWQVMPKVGSTKTKEASRAYLYTEGESTAVKMFVESPGRFAAAPTLMGDTCTLSPRAEGTSAVYYALASYDVHSFSVVDQLMLPQTIKPFSAQRIQGAFVFQIAANYESGGLLGKMGTYIAKPDNAFLCVSREPLAPPVYTKEVYVVKNQASYIDVCEQDQTYSVLGAANRSTNWGEYPARVGEANDFLTYATVKNYDTGLPESVKLRRFT